MGTTNYYWPIYRNLEKEVLLIADNIHFCDTQLDVYSVKVADTLFRTSAEIESLIKDLYRRETEEEPAKPGDALVAINDLWKLDKKLVTVSAANIYFQEDANKVFAPFNYSSGDENDYYTAYNAVKHDRVKNISKATIRVLMRSLAALYLLNLYYKDENIGTENRLDPDVFGQHFTKIKNSDIVSGSDIFSAKTSFVSFPSRKPKETGEDACFGPEDSVYLQIATPQSCEKEWKRIETETAKVMDEVVNICHEKNITITDGRFKGKPLYQVAGEVGGDEIRQRAVRASFLNPYNLEANIVLNKGQRIY